MMPASHERAVNAYYESEAALRMVSTELRALNLRDDGGPSAAADATAEPPDVSDATAGLLSAFDRALAILVPGYPVTDEQECDHLVVRRALAFEVGGIVSALTGDAPSPVRGAPLALRH